MELQLYVLHLIEGSIRKWKLFARELQTDVFNRMANKILVPDSCSAAIFSFIGN